MSSFYRQEELVSLGLKKYGKNVCISRNATFYGAGEIELSDNVRIDDFCILSGPIKIGRNVHIAPYSALYAGDAGITLDDFANISSRVGIYAISDDFSGQSMTNPTVPEKYKKVFRAPVRIGKHVIVGTGSTILPGVNLAEGTAVGSMSLIKSDTEAYYIYAGVPAVKIKERSRELIKMEELYMRENP